MANGSFRDRVGSVDPNDHLSHVEGIERRIRGRKTEAQRELGSGTIPDGAERGFNATKKFEFTIGEDGYYKLSDDPSKSRVGRIQNFSTGISDRVFGKKYLDLSHEQQTFVDNITLIIAKQFGMHMDHMNVGDKFHFDFTKDVATFRFEGAAGERLSGDLKLTNGYEATAQATHDRLEEFERTVDGSKSPLEVALTIGGEGNLFAALSTLRQKFSFEDRVRMITDSEIVDGPDTDLIDGINKYLRVYFERIRGLRGDELDTAIQRNEINRENGEGYRGSNAQNMAWVMWIRYDIFDRDGEFKALDGAPPSSKTTKAATETSSASASEDVPESAPSTPGFVSAQEEHEESPQTGPDITTFGGEELTETEDEGQYISSDGKFEVVVNEDNSLTILPTITGVEPIQVEDKKDTEAVTEAFAAARAAHEIDEHETRPPSAFGRRKQGVADKLAELGVEKDGHLELDGLTLSCEEKGAGRTECRTADGQSGLNIIGEQDGTARVIATGPDGTKRIDDATVEEAAATIKDLTPEPEETAEVPDLSPTEEAAEQLGLDGERVRIGGLTLDVAESSEKEIQLQNEDENITIRITPNEDGSVDASIDGPEGTVELENPTRAAIAKVVRDIKKPRQEEATESTEETVAESVLDAVQSAAPGLRKKKTEEGSARFHDTDSGADVVVNETGTITVLSEGPDGEEQSIEVADASELPDVLEGIEENERLKKRYLSALSLFGMDASGEGKLQIGPYDVTHVELSKRGVVADIPGADAKVLIYNENTDKHKPGDIVIVFTSYDGDKTHTPFDPDEKGVKKHILARLATIAEQSLEVDSEKAKDERLRAQEEEISTRVKDRIYREYDIALEEGIGLYSDQLEHLSTIGIDREIKPAFSVQWKNSGDERELHVSTYFYIGNESISGEATYIRRDVPDDTSEIAKELVRQTILQVDHAVGELLKKRRIHTNPKRTLDVQGE